MEEKPWKVVAVSLPTETVLGTWTTDNERQARQVYHAMCNAWHWEMRMEFWLTGPGVEAVQTPNLKAPGFNI